MTRTVAILIFEGAELLDFAGPAEVFIVAERGRAFRVLTVAATRDPVTTMGGIAITPSCSFADVPSADVLVLPGGDTKNVDEVGIEWIRSTAARAEVVISVCYGAFLLARAGLLEGIEATTHHWGLDELARAAPTCKVARGPRAVDAGKVVTTAGVTAGIDGALHVVERFHGAEAARWAAEEWLEHARSPAAARNGP